MKTSHAKRAGIISRRLILSVVVLVMSGSLVIIPADAFAHHRKEVEVNADRAVALAQRLVAVETSQVQALGGQLARTYTGVVARVERDFQRFFQLLHLSHP
jgi:hypothetical protein